MMEVSYTVLYLKNNRVFAESCQLLYYVEGRFQVSWGKSLEVINPGSYAQLLGALPTLEPSPLPASDHLEVWEQD